MSAPQAGKAHNMRHGWLWLTGEDADGLSVTLRADSVIMIEPEWDKERDICTGCLVHLTSGTVYATAAMPHEVEDAIKEALTIE